MVAKVLEFPKTVTPEQALMEALDMARNNDLQDALVIGHDGAGDLVIVASGALTGKDALWMMEQAKALVLDPESW